MHGLCFPPYRSAITLSLSRSRSLICFFPQDRLVDEGEDEEEQREGPDDDEDDDYDDEDDEDDDEGWVNMGILSSTWSFITTFFASLIPEAVPNAVN